MELTAEGASQTVAGERAARYSEPWKIEVLLVDDSEMDRSWVARLLSGLEEFEATITQATSLQQAARLIATRDFHVALIDYRLGDALGDEVVGAVKQARPSCATILMSSHTMSEVSLFGLRAGANAALCKDDINPGLLETTIRFALFNQARHRNGV